MLSEIYKPGTPVIAWIGGQWRHGFYIGLTGWHTHHLVCHTASVNMRSGWRIRDAAHIKPDPHRRRRRG